MMNDQRGSAETSPAARLTLWASLMLCVAIALLVALRPNARAQGAKGESAAPLTELKIVERVNLATDKALDYLEAKQSKAGESAGSWSPNMAMNAVAVLAYLSKGHVPGRGKYGDLVEGNTVKPGVLTRAKKYILAQSKKANPPGYLSSSSMYEHGLCTTAVAEMYGMDADPELEEAVRKAVDLIVKCQSPAGGWRYSPAPVDQDLSVSVMQIVALRAANNAEIPVPQATIDKAIKYVQNCASSPTGPGFGYAGAGVGPQTTPAGILSLQLLGKYDDPRLPSSLDYTLALGVGWPGGAQYFYYSHYYAIQATYQAGGKYWNEWHPKVRELLLSKQNTDGSWDVPPGSAEANLITADNKTYSTALATLILSIYQHYLPAYQR